MSDQPSQVPLLELARSIPKNLRAEWEIQWAEDGTPTGHSMYPVGRYVHELADELEAAQRQITELDKQDDVHWKTRRTLVKELEAKDKRIVEIQAVVNEQAGNDGLWFIAKYATEAYLQSELRRLHEVIEGKASL